MRSGTLSLILISALVSMLYAPSTRWSLAIEVGDLWTPTRRCCCGMLALIANLQPLLAQHCREILDDIRRRLRQCIDQIFRVTIGHRAKVLADPLTKLDELRILRRLVPGSAIGRCDRIGRP